MGAPRGTVEQRFWRKVDVGDWLDCWPWTGSIGYGYGKLYAGEVGAAPLRAHRVAYELMVGPIPDGLHLDHTCHTHDLTCPGGASCPHRRCVNPLHLEPVTQAENSARGRPWQLRKTHCLAGHPYSGDNLIIRARGGRSCRECAKRYKAEYDARCAERAA